MPIRRSPNGAGHTRPQPGRDRPEWVVAINRNAWSQSIGIGGRNQPVRAGALRTQSTPPVRPARNWIRLSVLRSQNGCSRYCGDRHWARVGLRGLILWPQSRTEGEDQDTDRVGLADLVQRLSESSDEDPLR